MEAPALPSLWGELLVVALLIPSRKAHAILYIELCQRSIDDSLDSVQNRLKRIAHFNLM